MITLSLTREGRINVHKGRVIPVITLSLTRKGRIKVHKGKIKVHICIRMTRKGCIKVLWLGHLYGAFTQICNSQIKVIVKVGYYFLNSYILIILSRLVSSRFWLSRVEIRSHFFGRGIGGWYNLQCFILVVVKLQEYLLND